MKSKLQEHFGERIVQTESNDKPNVITFRTTARKVLMFLPIIDMNPSDSTCIYSTLMFISNHAKKHGVTPILTFDQPLWWKALTIVELESAKSNLRKIVLCLGGFHTEMNFLGCIGHLIDSSGRA